MSYRRTASKVYVIFGKTLYENFMDRFFNGRQGESQLRDEIRGHVKKWAENRYAGYSPRLRWERTLGCSCGCSPGFRITVDGFHPDCVRDRDRFTKCGPAKFLAHLDVDGFRVEESKRNVPIESI